MWYREQSNQYINDGTQFVIDGVTYPSAWLNQASLEQKTALGLAEVVATNSPYDPKYYWTGEQLNGATLTYTGTAKDLAEVKNNAITDIRATAYSLLLPTDWMVVKAFETSTPMNADWSAWRASIRQTTNNAVTAIESASNVEEVKSVVQSIVWANDPSGV